jgi:hypothetical protein
LLHIRTLTLCLAICLVASAGCKLAAVRGRVVDMHDRPVPGVAVTVADDDDQAVSNALGEYEIGYTQGFVLLRFYKTGFAPAELHLDLPDEGSLNAPPVKMWRLPANQGVYLEEGDRFVALEPFEPERLFLQEGGFGLGAKRAPEVATMNATPTIVSFKMPRDGARLSRLEKRFVALGEVGEQVHHIEAWVAEKSVPTDLRPLDEPEQLLRQVRLPEPLEPGVYAVHWGALDGYTTIDTRMYYFRVGAPEAPEVSEATPEEEPVAEDEEDATPDEAEPTY